MRYAFKMIDANGNVIEEGFTQHTCTRSQLTQGLVERMAREGHSTGSVVVTRISDEEAQALFVARSQKMMQDQYDAMGAEECESFLKTWAD